MCSTRYTASASEKTLEALCDPESRYDGPTPSSGDFDSGPNWHWLGSTLVYNDGMQLDTETKVGVNPLIAGLTGQFQLTESTLNPELPSLAEALLSMASCTTLDLIQDFPFVPIWVRLSYIKG